MSGAYREIAKLSDLYPKEQGDINIGVKVENPTPVSDLELARRLAHIIEAGTLEHSG